MEKDIVMKRVKKVISEVLNIDGEIDNEANFVFDLGADSMQSVQLVAGFEEEFEIEMEEDEALKIQSVSDAAEFISKYL